ncbi:hypothetical protein BDY19DRAFT_518554 [Irpex rosettiformis]|uniref:Uncharacterized protein n=1 Tax=Irpex rosettiformis TaxID=378272 RepID=A0ACB8TRX4_9APHY|nr:hypothetical protein BDY19DRAFT_518554 [Irpex rosettiformis]
MMFALLRLVPLLCVDSFKFHTALALRGFAFTALFTFGHGRKEWLHLSLCPQHVKNSPSFYLTNSDYCTLMLHTWRDE